MVAKATRLRSSRPPTELADGFGPEEALRAMRPRTHARFTPGDRWVPGPRGHPAARFGGVRSMPPGSRAGVGRTVDEATRGIATCHSLITKRTSGHRRWWIRRPRTRAAGTRHPSG